MDKNTRKKHAKVTTRHSSDIAALHQKANISIPELMEMFPQYSRASVYRHAKRDVTEEPPVDRRNTNSGRPSKLSVRDKRKIIQTFKRLRHREGSFTAVRVREEAGLVRKVCVRTVPRVLKSFGYRYLRSRKKGLMTAKDKMRRVKFCRKIKNLRMGQEFWNKYISFYLDGKGFQFKTNPHGQARAPKAREWRLPSEGLEYTSKGKKEGATNVNFMVAISYGKGAVLCEQYDGTITGKKMKAIVENRFPEAFKKSSSPTVKRFLTDGCPRQNCKVALTAYRDVGAKVCKIPPRSPDMNPIENFFHLVVRKLDMQAIQENITRETKQEFAERVKSTMLNFPVPQIDKIINSMSKRVNLIIKNNGKRIKY